MRDIVEDVTVRGGERAVVHRVQPVIEVLYRHGAIDRDQYAAGRDFERAFHVAALDGTRCSQFERRAVSASVGVLADAVVDARRVVGDTMMLLGGYGSVMGSAVWDVVGMQMSLREAAVSPVCERGLRGVVIAALDIMARNK